MKTTSNQRFHVGAYGILINENKILLIKKSRGAYRGMYDFPGGGIEFNERIEEALKREFIEETGVILDNFSFLDYNEHFCDYLSEGGENRSLHHIAFYFKVFGNVDKIKEEPDGQDSLGAELVDIDNLDKIEIAPIARPIIEKLIKENQGSL